MKFLFKFAPMLLIGAFMLTSCNKHDDSYNPNYKNDLAISKYKTNFEAKYGQVSENATWDFSAVPTIKDEVEVLTCEQPTFGATAGKRAISSAAVPGAFDYGLEPNQDIYITGLQTVNSLNELAYIRTYAADLEVKEWTEEQIYGVHDMWVWYVHGFEGQETTLADMGGYAMYSLGIHVMESGTGSYGHGTEYFTSLPIMGGAATNGWYYGYGNGARGGTGSRIDASKLKNNDAYSNIYWFAMVDDGTPQTSRSDDGTLDDRQFREKFELKTYKEYVTPMGAVYWLFDCNHDGDYTDLVCLVEPVEASKRYMVEDLGATDDFDFNDLVIDVRAYGDRQWAIVRAMGGTLDFTVKIGNTTWTKSESGMNVSTMYNTRGNIDYNAELAVFDVTGWDPLANNISITVKGKDSDVPQVIPFPKKGDVPMIIAEHPARKWMNERVSIPEEWFTTE
jgi:hypothetical protein